jgi:hypothetical protein
MGFDAQSCPGPANGVPEVPMLTHILRNTEWSQLSSLVSPAFFDVLPMRTIYRRGRALMSTRTSEAYRAALAARSESLRAVPLAIVPTSDLRHEVGTTACRDGLGSDVHAHGERILTLYFHQLFSDGVTLLDLRGGGFRREPNALAWSPAAWLCSWDPTFHEALRAIYRGFYADDDRAFRKGLATLGIASCEGLFRQAFGGDSDKQTFRTKEFVAIFHQVFVRCREQKIELHPDFLPLGIYLATLYDALDATGVALPVRACFARAIRLQSLTPAERMHAI